MNDGITQEIDAERDQILDVQRLIQAVRGSRAARVLFDYRAPPRSFNAVAPDTDSGSSATPICDRRQ